MAYYCAKVLPAITKVTTMHEIAQCIMAELVKYLEMLLGTVG